MAGGLEGSAAAGRKRITRRERQRGEKERSFTTEKKRLDKHRFMIYTFYVTKAQAGQPAALLISVRAERQCPDLRGEAPVQPSPASFGGGEK